MDLWRGDCFIVKVEQSIGKAYRAPSWAGASVRKAGNARRKERNLGEGRMRRHCKQSRNYSISVGFSERL